MKLIYERGKRISAKVRTKCIALHVGSFRDITQATTLRQELLNLDLASIEIYKKGITTWNRVVINHSSILEVRANKTVLRKHQVDTLVIEKKI
ncbi:MAG: SPOR domain-containing protein [Methylococcaceae bacterium]